MPRFSASPNDAMYFCMAVISLLFAIGALRYHACMVTICGIFTVVFALLGAGEYGHIHKAMDKKTEQALSWTAGLLTFVACLVGWYLWYALVLDAIDFPIRLPIGDLKGWIKSRTERRLEKAKKAEEPDV